MNSQPLLEICGIISIEPRPRSHSSSIKFNKTMTRPAYQTINTAESNKTSKLSKSANFIAPRGT